jgi:hypothetical protein
LKPITPAGYGLAPSINAQFVSAGGTYNEYTAAIKAAINRGYIDLHPSGAYLTFTQAGAELFA